MLLGCIADDFTGATDLALMLKRGGMRTVLVVGLPRRERLPDADAIVVALKSRTIPAQDAIEQSLQSADALLAGGARLKYFRARHRRCVKLIFLASARRRACRGSRACRLFSIPLAANRLRHARR